MPEYKCFDQNGKCFPPSNPVYLKISEKMKELDSHVTPKHVYTIINNDRQGITSEILKEYDITINNIENSFNESEENSFEHFFGNDNKKSSFENNKVFKLVISEKIGIILNLSRNNILIAVI